MRKRDFIYPTLLLLLFAFMTAGGNAIFGYSPPEKHTDIENEPPQPEYEYISAYARISDYDGYFRMAADSIGIEWALIAAIAYTESRFDSTAVSGVGARGVMQMMPVTLRGLEVPDSLHADNHSNIHASARYIKQLFNMYRHIKNYDEIINFVLASYNAGYGHINDAMRLARKYGHKHHVWHSSVDSFLIKKSLPEYYTDSVCRNGKFSDWKQTLSFVNKVKQNWKKFNNRQNEYRDSINALIATDPLKRIAF